MGHLAAKQVYRDLQIRLDRMPVGAPNHEALFEILKTLFSEEEAWIASRMPIRFTTIDTIVSRTGKREPYLKPLLEGMAEKGLLMDLERPNGKVYYVLCPTVIGFFEFSMMRVRSDYDQRKLSHLYHEYMLNDPQNTFLKQAVREQTQLVRTLVHETALSEENFVEILNYERASEIIREAKLHAVSLCHCRHVKHHLGEDCGHPMENCLSLGRGTNFLIKRKLAKQIDRDQALDILAQARELGMVQSADNVQNRVSFICNCCGCSCSILEAFKRIQLNENSTHTSNYIAYVNSESCTGCGKCVQACPIEAISMKAGETTGERPAKQSIIDESRCLGCGVCVSSCPFKVITMQRRSRRIFTPEDSLERVLLMALERKKLHHLIFDNIHSIPIRAINYLMGFILNRPAIHRFLLKEGVKSRCIDFLLHYAKR